MDAPRITAAVLVSLVVGSTAGFFGGRTTSGAENLHAALTSQRARTSELSTELRRLHKSKRRVKGQLESLERQVADLLDQNEYLKGENQDLLATVRDRPATTEEILAAVERSTVLVLASNDDGSGSKGTGWVLDQEEGFIVTNHHVVNGGTIFSVAVQGEERFAELVGAAPCHDLALLRVDDTSGLKTLPLGSQAELDEGEAVVAVGFPVSLSVDDNMTATAGVVSVASTDVSTDPPHENMVQTDATINPGNSGGPLVNAEAELVGVNTLVPNEEVVDVKNQSYAIGVDEVAEVVSELRKGNSIGWTGMNFATDEDVIAAEGYPTGQVISDVVPGTAAAAAGLGDEPFTLSAIGSQPVDQTMTSYCEAVASLESGDTARFTIVEDPGGEPLDVTVQFE